jgi:hypothetical protein
MAKPEKTGKKSMTEILMGGSLKGTTLLSKSDLMIDPNFIKTRVPLINVALCGDIEGGLSYGFNQIAGPSRHFKTSFGLVMVKAFLDKDPENMVVFYDSEFGAKQQYLTNFGIDGSRVVYIPIMNIEELKFDIASKLEALEKDAKVMFFIDSIGNLPSKKEIEDAIAEKSAADMTRAKQLKSLGRIVTPQLNYKRIPLIAINHTYKTMEMFSKDVVSGGCVLAGTKIIMANGDIKNIEDVIVGEYVKTKDGDQKVTHTWNPETLEEGHTDCLEIVLDDDFEVVCTKKHKFFVNGEWVEAQNLKLGDTVDGLESRRVKLISNVGKKDVYDISVDVSESYVLENGIFSHNTGVQYSSDIVWIIGRSQDKNDTTGEMDGYYFTINIDKSRFVKEKSKFAIRVGWEGGIARWSGMADLAEEFDIIKSGRGAKNKKIWEFVDKDGVVHETFDSEVDVDDEFWERIIKETKIGELISKKFKI